MPLALQIAERLVSLALEENNEHSFIQPRPHLQRQRKALFMRAYTCLLKLLDTSEASSLSPVSERPFSHQFY